jgi:hypothetical protein
MPPMTTPSMSRAQRVSLKMPVQYRVKGDDHWFQSQILNISESGVLFGPSELQAGMPVELIFSMPIQVGSIASGKLMCEGAVVRTTELGAAGARFEDVRFLLEA